MKEAKITLKKQGEIADIVARSLHPETERNIPRTDVAISEDDDAVHLVIRAEDVSALRAAVNSYLRWIKISMDTYEETSIKEGSGS